MNKTLLGLLCNYAYTSNLWIYPYDTGHVTNHTGIRPNVYDQDSEMGKTLESACDYYLMAKEHKDGIGRPIMDNKIVLKIRFHYPNLHYRFISFKDGKWTIYPKGSLIVRNFGRILDTELPVDVWSNKYCPYCHSLDSVVEDSQGFGYICTVCDGN